MINLRKFETEELFNLAKSSLPELYVVKAGDNVFYTSCIDTSTQPNNEIWYTTTDGNVIQPYQTEGFDANIVSNVYENGKGIITFDAPLTKMEVYDDYGVFDGEGSSDIANRLTSISLPSSVTSIGNYAFSHCTSLTSVTIPSSVTSIGDSAFSNCDSLTSIDIPSGVTSIGSSTFYYCWNLTSIYIPSSVTSIGDNAFWKCTSLTSVMFAEGSRLTSIGLNAFYRCVSLTSVTFAEDSHLTNISNYAFKYCGGLTSIEIPSSVTNIGGKAFENCNGLTSITYKGVTYTSISTLTTALTNNGVTVGDNAFSNTNLSA